MSSIRAPLRVKAGSFEPVYWLVADPTTGLPIDLTAPGFAVAMVVEDEHGTELLTAAQLASSLRLTADGRVYFEPSSSVSTAWPVMRASYQIELAHPSGEKVRIGRGPWSVDYEMIKV